MAKNPKIKASEEWPIIQPPASVNIPKDKQVILYTPDGTPLVRKIGF